MAKFESRVIQNSKNMVLQNQKILQTFVCWGSSLCPQRYKRLKNFPTLRSYNFAISKDSNPYLTGLTNF